MGKSITIHLNQSEKRIEQTLRKYLKGLVGVYNGNNLKICDKYNDNWIFVSLHSFKDHILTYSLDAYQTSIVTLEYQYGKGIFMSPFIKNKTQKSKQKMKIRIKAKNEIDLTNIYPKINETEFDIIQDQYMHLNSAQYKKMLDSKFLDFAGFQISIDLIETYEEESISEHHLAVQEAVDEKFIYANDVVDVLMAGLEVGKNIILWGRGGHGKSEITELVLDKLYELGFLKEPAFVQAFGDGLTEDKLFGGMNIKKFRDEGQVEYLPENSFMNHEVVVFEELFDAPPSVLLSLKDIMTSKRFRQGNETFNIRTKVFIGLTNKSKDEFSEKDESLKALADRFPLCYKTEWGHYNKTDFMKLFQKVLGEKTYKKYPDKLNQLAEILQYNNTNGTSFVSPRTAVSAAQLYIANRNLKFISEIDEKTLADFNKQKRETVESGRQEQLLKNIEKYLEDQNLDILSAEDDFLKDLQAAQEASGGSKLDLSDLNQTSGDLSVKQNKLKFLENTLAATSILPKLDSKAKALNKRIKEAINNIDLELKKNKK